MTTSTTTESELSPTALAAALAAALMALILILSLLAPKETLVDLDRLEELVTDGHVERIEIVEVGFIGRLRQAVVIEQEGRAVRTQDVLVSVLDGAQVEAAVDRWRAAGVLVVAGETGGDQRWARDLAWTAIVGGLLLFGVYHLVQQARLHRREGSPRERLAEAQAELEAGRISREEFERRAAEITPEL